MRRNPLAHATLLSVALHGYIAIRLIPALELGGVGNVALVGMFVASALLAPAPLLIRLNRLSQPFGDALAWAGYLAMGVFSSLLVLTLLHELALLVVWLGSSALGSEVDWAATRYRSALAVLALTAFVTVVGLFNARRTPRIVSVDLPIPKLPKALVGFSIAQLSDIHIGPTIKRRFLDPVVDRVNAARPDLIAITGDVVDGSVDQLRPHVAPLSRLHARHGTYCVTGNHEYYHGVDAWLAEWRRLGLQVLVNEGRMIEHDGEHVLIGGVADYSAHHFKPAHRSDPVLASKADKAAAVKILLAHQPRSAFAAASAGFDVQLSGHTHGGQFWPWPLLVPMQQPIVSGLRRLETMWVYVSRGTGYWGPPLRFGAPSEITMLRLVAAPT